MNQDVLYVNKCGRAEPKAQSHDVVQSFHYSATHLIEYCVMEQPIE